MDYSCSISLFLMLAFTILPILIVGWPSIYRYVFFPKRKPDFEHRLYVYWFDEKIAYSRLATQKKLKFFEKKGILYEDFGTNTKYTELFDISGKLELEVQQAYQQHVYKKFEEVVLGSE